MIMIMIKFNTQLSTVTLTVTHIQSESHSDTHTDIYDLKLIMNYQCETECRKSMSNSNRQSLITNQQSEVVQSQLQGLSFA